jgi:signal transduction histidine kinase
VTGSDRLGLVARAFFLATVLGLAFAFTDTSALRGSLALVVVAALSLLAGRAPQVAPRWVCVVEGLVAAVVVGVTLPGGELLLPYLMVPALLAGAATDTAARATAVVLVAGGEMAGLLLTIAVGATSTSVHDGAEIAAPWAVASLGAGLMAVWVTQLRGAGRGDDASYESARRLLSQLRTVARRLSSGLDPVSITEDILATTHAALDDAQSGLFVRTEGGELNPLGYRGRDSRHLLVAEDHVTERCWATTAPVEHVQASGRAETRHRVALTLRVGPRMIGMVVAEAAAAPTPRLLTELMRTIDEQALRLDTALIFDEVRSLATMEERQRVAREIHDGVAQEVASLGYVVDDLSADAITEAQRTKLRSLRTEISRVVSELRLSIFDLRSEISPSAGLGSALSDYVRTVGARSGLTVHLTLDEASTRLRGEIETELLRIAQEAVTNARRHSQAENLWVHCRVRPPYAQITVEDDGRGLGPARPDAYGLKIMRERADRIHATLEIGERDGAQARGTRVAVTLGQDVR